jgi:hypothetical protein
MADNRLKKPEQTYVRRNLSPLAGDSKPWQGTPVKPDPQYIGDDADSDYYRNFRQFDRPELSSREPNRKK